MDHSSEKYFRQSNYLQTVSTLQDHSPVQPMNTGNNKENDVENQMLHSLLLTQQSEGSALISRARIAARSL